MIQTSKSRPELTPPHSNELERSVLGLLILFPEHIPEIAAECFYDAALKSVYQQLRIMYDTVPITDINLPMLAEQVKTAQTKIEASFVSALLDGIPRSAEKDLPSIIKKLKDLSMRRTVARATQYISSNIHQLTTEELSAAILKLREVNVDADVVQSKSLSEEVRAWVAESSGEFTIGEIHKIFNLNTKAERKHVATVLCRLMKDKTIQRAGKMNGHYRRVENDYAPIKWKEAELESYPILYPLDLQDMALTYGKNIIVVAGAKDVGKTAYLLNLASRNMDTHEVNYFSSEMGEVELKLRLSLFDHLKPEDWKVKFWERSDKYDDVIVPDALNIIDYLQVEDEFYAVGSMIRKIFDKLNKGVAIIGLQKDPDSVMGRGKWFSAEKARIYITLDHHRLKILCGKNRTSPSVNPVGMVRKFKLLHGWDFIPDGGWEYEASSGGGQRYQRTDYKPDRPGFKF